MTDEYGRKIDAIDRKVDQLEKDVQKMTLSQAVRDEQFKTIEKGLGRIQTDMRWGLLIVVGAVLSAAAQFMLRGGLIVTGG